MFGIGSTELLVILVVALIVLGPKSLASISKTLGKMMGEFRRASTDFQRALNIEAAEEDRRQAAAKSAAAAAHASDSNAAQETAPPPDSPLAQAIAKAKAEADKQSPARADGATTHGA